MDIFEKIARAQDSPENPLDLFKIWMADAESAEINDPNAMSLATIDVHNRPAVRIVLLKHWDADGFVFYTNRASRKGQDIAAHPFAALCLHWKTLGRQVRIEGCVEWVSDAESDAYYNSRPLGSRIGAWASKQSSPLPDRQTLINEVQDLEQKFAADSNIPRPPHWGGYRVIPNRIEFWHDGESRLHTRVAYSRDESGDGWIRTMLYP
jgi:pyridoxamine 5'-phosphate oxidase